MVGDQESSYSLVSRSYFTSTLNNLKYSVNLCIKADFVFNLQFVKFIACTG